ncbi:putative transposase (plasmid) [Paraburkholderia fungorum]|uniref:Transposase n=2 Tax=Paraburkholderia fungorum TaxID=134537 RepID=A0AAU8SS61_9BURK|nr:putative transposase [Paraburkholderia fungorum]
MGRATSIVRKYRMLCSAKPWIFADTVAGAYPSVNLYSLVEFAKASGIEPYQYLVHLFSELPKATTADHYIALLPWATPPHL